MPHKSHTTCNEAQNSCLKHVVTLSKLFRGAVGKHSGQRRRHVHGSPLQPETQNWAQQNHPSRMESNTKRRACAEAVPLENTSSVKRGQHAVHVARHILIGHVQSALLATAEKHETKAPRTNTKMQRTVTQPNSDETTATRRRMDLAKHAVTCCAKGQRQAAAE